MPDYHYLTIERTGGVVTCIMSNPPRHTLVAAEVSELQQFVDSLAADSAVRVVVFSGAGEGVFIAHYEVGELAASAERQTGIAASGPELHAFHKVILSLQEAPFITVAAVNGNAAGGGFEFALGCDFRLAREGAYRLGLPETGVGIIPGAGGTQRYARLLGTAGALDLILHAQTLTPTEALALGLVHRVYDQASFGAEVEAFATNLAGRAPVALAAAKRAIYEGADLSLRAGLLIEQREFSRCMASEDAATAMRSWLDGKTWTWQGR
ncbi:MAG: enoyl-CoA hydratase/isomerase family protein [Tepidiformaceae bacterium]